MIKTSLTRGSKIVVLLTLGFIWSFSHVEGGRSAPLPAGSQGEQSLKQTAACPQVENTPSFTIAYGDIMLEGSPASVGSIVEAINPRGDVVGCFSVTDEGYFGAMYIYGEDTSVNPPIPGMRDGEQVKFQASGTAGLNVPGLVWVDDKDLHELDLSSVQIIAAGADLTLSWYGQSSGIDHYEVWRSHTDPYFSQGNSGSFKLGDITPPASPGMLSHTDIGAVGDTSTDTFYLINAVYSNGPDSNSGRLGEYTINVLPGWNMITWPLLPEETALDAVLGTQLYGTANPETADRVLVWDGATQSYESAWFCGGPVCEGWGEPWANHWLAGDYSQSPLTLEPDTGFWIQNRSGSAETLVVLGSIAEADRAVQINPGWQYLGSAFLFSETLDDASIPATGTGNPETADRILYWDAATQTYRSAWYCGGPVCEGWGEPWANHWLAGDYSQTDIVLGPGHGFWLQNRHGSFEWINQR